MSHIVQELPRRRQHVVPLLVTGGWILAALAGLVLILSAFTLIASWF